MCTMIASKVTVMGGAKNAQGWFPLTHAIVGYDHASYLRDEHALQLDFVNPGIDASARVAVELDIESGKALIAQIQAAIDEAERTGAVR